MDFTGKVVLVTGGSSRIGAAIAVMFATHGASVAIVGRNKAKLKNVSEKCERKGNKQLVIVADVTKDVDVKKIVSETIGHYSRLDILVNNAGRGGALSIFAEGVMGLVDRIMTTNFRSVVHLTNLAVPYLVETKGNIINISSITAKVVVADTNFAYCASRAALDHFSRCIALELAPKGVRLNTVNPGPVKTGIIENMAASESEEDTWERMNNANAPNRFCKAEEIADLVLFLASDKARSITGSSFVSDNGFILKGYME